jgi:hypothetical protein
LFFVVFSIQLASKIVRKALHHIGELAHSNHLLCSCPMLILAMLLTFGRTTTRTVKPANTPSFYSRSAAWLAGALGSRGASGRGVHQSDKVHGVNVTFHG